MIGCVSHRWCSKEGRDGLGLGVLPETLQASNFARLINRQRREMDPLLLDVAIQRFIILAARQPVTFTFTRPGQK